MSFFPCDCAAASATDPTNSNRETQRDQPLASAIAEGWQTLQDREQIDGDAAAGLAGELAGTWRKMVDALDPFDLVARSRCLRRDTSRGHPRDPCESLLNGAECP